MLLTLPALAMGADLTKNIHGDWGTGWNQGWTVVGSATLTGHDTFIESDLGSQGKAVLLIDPGGSARNFNPSGAFEIGATLLLENTADAAEVLTFDSTGIAIAIAQDKSGLFIYNGSAWEEISPHASTGATYNISFTHNAMVATDDWMFGRAFTEASTVINYGGALHSGTNIIGKLYICNGTSDLTNPMDIAANCDACDSADITFDGGEDREVAPDGVVAVGIGYRLAFVTNTVAGGPGFFTFDVNLTVN